MFNNLLFTVVALTGLAVSAPSQLEIHGTLGRHVQVSASIGGPHYRHYAPPVRRAGYYRTVVDQVWVPGCYQEQFVPAQYGWCVGFGGHRHWGVVRAGYTHRVWVPGYYETRNRRVWVNGHRRGGVRVHGGVVAPPRRVAPRSRGVAPRARGRAVAPRQVVAPRGVATQRGERGERGQGGQRGQRGQTVPRGRAVGQRSSNTPPRGPGASRRGGRR